MKNIKRIACIIMLILILVGSMYGCQNQPENQISDSESSYSNKMEKEAETLDEINSLLKSWEIFNKTCSEENSDMFSETLTEASKKAIASEADNQKIRLNLYCRGDLITAYKRFADSFRQFYSDPSRYTIEIKINASDDYFEKYISDPEKEADVILCKDSELAETIASGNAAIINDNIKKMVETANTEEAIRSCTFNNKLYGIPAFLDSGYYLIYDKRVFTAEEIQNLDKMIQIANKKAKNIAYLIDDPYYSSGIFLAAGCRLENDGKTQIIDYNNENGFNAAKTICQLSACQDHGFIGVGNAQSVISGFSDGNICAAVIDSNYLSEIKKTIGEYNTGIAKLPEISINQQNVNLHSLYGFSTAVVNPHSAYPFTSQLFAYYLTSASSQQELYNYNGIIPSSKIYEYDYIINDPFYIAVMSQSEYSHIRTMTVGNHFSEDMESYNIAKIILEKNGNLSDEQLRNLLEEIPQSIIPSRKIAAQR